MFRRTNQIHWRIKTVKYFLLYYCYSYFVRLIKRVCDSLSHVCRCCKQISPDVFLNNKLVFFYYYSILSMICFACFLTVNIHVRDGKIFTSNISRRLHHFFNKVAASTVNIRDRYFRCLSFFLLKQYVSKIFLQFHVDPKQTY
jgi:hypothetical protein